MEKFFPLESERTLKLEIFVQNKKKCKDFMILRLSKAQKSRMDGLEVENFKLHFAKWKKVENFPLKWKKVKIPSDFFSQR